MNIIIEGCDKAGKSTITRDIREALALKNPVVFKISQKPLNSSPEQQKQIVARYQELFAQTQNPLNEDQIFLFDRSYPSEMVYSFKRGYDSMNSYDLLKLDADLGFDKRTLLIYCEADADTIADRFITEKEEFAQPEEITEILERYEEFLKITELPYIRINSLTDRATNLLTVKKFLNI